MESKIINCYVDPKGCDKEGPLFFSEKDENGSERVLCNLDGYAIIPMEKYDYLVANQKS